MSEKKKMDAYCEDYKVFLNASKTEREAVTETVRRAEAGRRSSRPAVSARFVAANYPSKTAWSGVVSRTTRSP